MNPRSMRNSQGQALVEAAIVLPLVVFVTAILIELCLISNAKSVLRYSAFCTARFLSVAPLANAGEIKTAAVIPLLGITGKSREADFNAVLQNEENSIAATAAAALLPGAGFAPSAPMAFNRDIATTLNATWTRTFVSSATEYGSARAEVTYFYHPVFPLARLTRMIQQLWDQDSDGEMYQRMQRLGNRINYEQWRTSDWIVLTATAELPLEPQ